MHFLLSIQPSIDSIAMKLSKSSFSLHDATATGIESRADLAKCQRIVVKCGTAIVSTADGHPSLARVAQIVENICQLRDSGREVLLVSSGSVGCGKQVLRRAALMGATPAQALASVRHASSSVLEPAALGMATHLSDENQRKRVYNSACAAAGQINLLTLYDQLFNTLDVRIAQVLVCNSDFADEKKVRNLALSIDSLLQAGCVPIINENDVVSAHSDETHAFVDNDALAALIARNLHADLLIVLTNVPGVYTANPEISSNAKLLRRVSPGLLKELDLTGKSSSGRGGMSSKISACLAAVCTETNDNREDRPVGDAVLPYKAIIGGFPVPMALIADGRESNVLLRACAGEEVGTLVAARDLPQTKLEVGSEDALKELAGQVSAGQKVLASLDETTRGECLLSIADALLDNAEDILRVNKEEVEEARKKNVATPLLNRLSLSKSKLETLADGIRNLSNASSTLNNVILARELTADLVLLQRRVPIGTLLIIFESRPDCLPQIASLAIKSGNGLLLKGGSEAAKTCALLHKLVVDCLESVGVPREAVSLVHTRNDITQLLKCEKYIDLVIPRGSNQLVRHIKANTNIPVLGHADGVCHAFIDEKSDEKMVLDIVLDAKLGYPAACNALETLLVHKSWLVDSRIDRLLRLLRSKGIQLVGGPTAVENGLVDQANAAKLRNGDEGDDPLHVEYGNSTLCVEVVDCLNDAIKHINTHGSGHTDVIISNDKDNVEQFLARVDSACVFHNASSRFSDGYRFGLGAEVGISTGRIHARGPVGVEGLLTTKYQVMSNSPSGHTVAACQGFSHQPLPVDSFNK